MSTEAVDVDLRKWLKRHNLPNILACATNRPQIASSANNIYEDIAVGCTTYDANSWQAVLAITMNEQELVVNSNSLLHDTTRRKQENLRTRIYDRLAYTKKWLCEKLNERQCTIIAGETFLLTSAYSGVNVGCELSTIIDSVSYIRKHSEIRKVAVLKEMRLNTPSNSVFLKMLLGERIEIVELDNDVAYRLSGKTHIIKDNVGHITKHADLVHELRKMVFERASDVPRDRDVILLNQPTTKNADCSVNTDLTTQLQNKGWFVLNPAESDVYDVVSTLLCAKRIVSFLGATLYAYMCFFNRYANVGVISPNGKTLTDRYALLQNKATVFCVPNAKSTLRVANLIDTTLKPKTLKSEKLLQMHWFTKATKEDQNHTLDISVDHRTSVCYLDKNAFPLCYPRTHVVLLRSMWRKSSERTIDCVFVGLLNEKTPRKLWVKNFSQIGNSVVRESLRGRSKTQKFEFDEQYFQHMCAAKYALCPTDIYRWSYRLLEAVMCGAIPILQSQDVDFNAFEAPFHCYYSDQPAEQWVYRHDWVEENYKMFLDKHTLYTTSAMKSLFAKSLQGQRKIKTDVEI